MTQEPDPRVTTTMTAPEAVNVGDDLDIVATYQNLGDLDRLDNLILIVQGSDIGIIDHTVVSITTEVNDPDTDDLLDWTFLQTGNMTQAKPPASTSRQRWIGEGNIVTIKARVKVNQPYPKIAASMQIRLTDIDSRRITQYPESVPHFIEVA